MYAMLDTDNQTVIACFPPDVAQDKIIEEANGRTLIEMTFENSPAYIQGKYIDGKFYPPKEVING
jgi:hypothetical protein